ncbi:MAG: Response regulator containing a CheY-like receiver domain and an HD-GYP domain [uncultured Sulfurovum sp.]|uniref:Response regulator containing a CheY-like receiver domain and an HD-GYP domain n=1 Tax=uncultured Sulfurovum sp. TaxID=269237 RepID=A0A6S6U727_9BACT|nr:MAG: Response regulator containing a CheY-like receiver domain and an HD-GYP domain [uncultured Sulfurovum sp.]
MTEHRLLHKQLKKAKISTLEDINEKNFKKLLQLIEQSYTDYDEDKKLYESKAQLSSLEFKELNKNLSEKVEELKKINHNIQDSIEYASLMQQAILPKLSVLDNFCKESFVYWLPKDIVGGDIYFFNILDENSILIMVIDGAGHGVSGAFLTMLVKAIEEQIIAKIQEGKLRPSPALILEYFNISIKIMLQQDKESQANSGFDGGVLYYNKKSNICKYAGAKTPLYIMYDDELEVIKSDRKSVGFVRTDIDQKYTEHTIPIEKNTRLYITTDGMPDQEGENDSRYGITQFKKLILKNQNLSFTQQGASLQKSFKDFKGNCKQSDDITVIGLSLFS